MEKESLAEMYYDRVIKEKNPVPVLVAFYLSLYDVPELKNVLYSYIGKLYKVYGTKLVYFSILDTYDVESFDYTKPFGLLSYFCKKRLENNTNFNTATDLNGFAEVMLKERKRKIKIPEI
jgi:hypothetical protein